ncbi:serine hydrolase domain-containing protein [Microvirga makkahensis]|uniref:Serine hydrolase n=1 Tax=Microvirga makkahensis TaxID=1128670 RepID=A0A7X3SRC3_9HYPH|nr:serine hydrolase domain-containing protein [Microvirga makkahensis]MXQ14193.1 serine hydrolase [Microvirga makkahensis]
MKRARVFLSASIGIIASMVVFSAGAEPSRPEKVQAALESWLAERAPLEKVTGIAAYISLGDPGPAIEAFAGTTGRSPSDGPVSQNTLFQMGSTSKSFTAAVLLKLEAAGTLSLDDTVGRWLPEYPAWQDVSIRRLLNMTSGIPNYSETKEMSRLWIEEPQRDLSAEELVRMVYPTNSNKLPATTGYHYSNTNYILASMIAEKATGKTFQELVHELVIEPLGLHSTFYESGTYPETVIRRLAHGYFENPACTDYQPKDCAASWNRPLLGRDVRAISSSWAQAAGGAISNPRDVTRWMQAVFAGQVVPAKQQSEWLRMISTRTGEPIAGLTAEDPRGFSLGLVQAILGPAGAHWFYEGETLGYRTLYVWFAGDNILITVQTNSQPAEGMDRLHDAVIAIYEAVKPPSSP